MIIVGAKNHARDLYSFIKNEYKELVFFDNISKGEIEPIDNCRVIRSFDEIKNYSLETNDFEFILGLGVPKYRELLYDKFINLGLKSKPWISKQATIGDYHVNVEDGAQILPGCILTANIKVGKGVLINVNSTISHDAVIGEFSEIAPGVSITGNVIIGNKVFIGVGGMILPNLSIGDQSIIAAGSVVTKDVPPNVLVAGVPAKIIKDLE